MDITRSFIETAVSKALRDIRRDPRRSIRNLVDLGQNFARGDAQRHFIGMAQSMLEKEDSSYYAAVTRTVQGVRHEALLTFSMNLGYNAFTLGARTIRQKEAELFVNIPWCLPIDYKRGAGNLGVADLRGLMDAARALGMHTFLFQAAGGEARDLAPLFAQFADCAFVLALTPGAGAEDLRALAAHDNLMICLDGMESAYLAQAQILSDARCLHAAFIRYAPENVQEALSPETIRELIPGGGVFLIYFAGEDCPLPVRTLVNRAVTRARMRQRYATFLVDFYPDTLFIDRAISTEGCFLAVDAAGWVHVPAQMQAPRENVLQAPFVDILLRTMPQATYLSKAGEGGPSALRGAPFVPRKPL